jgi:hypothetical protein
VTYINVCNGKLLKVCNHLLKLAARETETGSFFKKYGEELYKFGLEYNKLGKYLTN